jgi:hypothetical protein
MVFVLLRYRVEDDTPCNHADEVSPRVEGDIEILAYERVQAGAPDFVARRVET